MNASNPLPSAAYSVTWNEAPLADAVYVFWPTTPRLDPAGGHDVVRAGRDRRRVSAAG